VCSCSKRRTILMDFLRVGDRARVPVVRFGVRRGSDIKGGFATSLGPAGADFLFF